MVLWLRSQAGNLPPQSGAETTAFLRGEGAVTYSGNLAGLDNNVFKRFEFVPSVTTGSDSSSCSRSRACAASSWA